METLHRGDCRVELQKLPADSVDTCITDPPYEPGFMGKKWDSAGVAFDPRTWAAVYRVLKPGAMLLCFGGTRTYHRISCAIEDASFDLRDCMMWLYGSGFPKSLDISKAIDKAAGAERPKVGTARKSVSSMGPGEGNFSDDGYEWKAEFPVTVPATDAAKTWDGWGTALKPAWEPIIVAMKPCDGTFSQNALQHGVAGLNIDGGRITSEPRKICNYPSRGKQGCITHAGGGNHSGEEYEERIETAGRFPANLVLDEEAAAMLDEQSGTLKSGANPPRRNSDKTPGVYGSFEGHECIAYRVADSGGASRFFYCAKAGKKERGEGNTHPTVKPLALMEYLCTLTRTPIGGSVLDPFLGSGTTALAAINTGRPFIGIEEDEAYFALASRRIRRHRESRPVALPL